MKRLGITLSLLFCAVQAHAIIYPLPSDAFADEEKAAEAAKILNQDFQELWNAKKDLNTSSLGQAQYFVSDLLDAENADYNAFVIMENSDDLYRNKTQNLGSIGQRSYNISDLLDPANFENNVLIINQILYDLDSDLKETN